MVSTHPIISKSSSSCTNSLVTVPKAPITIDITVTFMFHNFFSPLARSRHVSFFSLPFIFALCSAETTTFTVWQILFFLLIITRSGRLAEISWPVCISKSQRSLCISFFRIDYVLWIRHLFAGSNFNFLHNSQWITLPTQSCLVLYSFCDSLLHSFIMWLIVSFLSPHNLHLLFCCVLSILTLIWLVLMALFCAAIRRDLVSLKRFPFLTHVHVFSFKTSIQLFFFPFLFSGYFRSVDPRVVSLPLRLSV